MGEHRLEQHNDGFWDQETLVDSMVPIRLTRSHAAPDYYVPDDGHRVDDLNRVDDLVQAPLLYTHEMPMVSDEPEQPVHKPLPVKALSIKPRSRRPITAAEVCYILFYAVVSAAMSITAYRGQWGWVLTLIGITVVGTMVAIYDYYLQHQQERREDFHRRYIRPYMQS